MIQFNLEVDTKRWLRGNKRNRQRIINVRKESARIMAMELRNWARYFVPKDTFNLFNSINMFDYKGTATVVARAKYAPFVEYGTGLYAENGRGRKTPWFYQHRKLGWIKTQGQRSQPFMRPALEIVNSRKSSILKGAWKRSGLSNR